MDAWAALGLGVSVRDESAGLGARGAWTRPHSLGDRRGVQRETELPWLVFLAPK